MSTLSFTEAFSGEERSTISFHFPGWYLFKITPKGLIWHFDQGRWCLGCTGRSLPASFFDIDICLYDFRVFFCGAHVLASRAKIETVVKAYSESLAYTSDDILCKGLIGIRFKSFFPGFSNERCGHHRKFWVDDGCRVWRRTCI